MERIPLMCKSVIIEGEAYETIGGLRERLSGNVAMLEGATQDSRLDGMCCCGVDVPATAALNGYTAADDGMDWHLWKEKPPRHSPGEPVYRSK